MPRTYIIAIGVLGIASAASPVRADPTDRGEPDVHDYSRFSDGPRNVPAPRGASLVRAQALGLGTREAATRARRGALPEAWLRAAAWRRQPVERLLWPVDDGRFARGFGFVRHTRPDLRHDGVDITAEAGAVVRAAADGIVVYSDNGIRGFGNCVILAHPNGWVTLYAHNARTTVQAGWRVRRGERIALVGSTGISHGPHVHFELFDAGAHADPLALFDGGPAFVQRVAERAHRAGRVPAPASEPLPPEPLAPLGEPRPGSPDASLGIGTAALARRLERFRPAAALIASVEGRHFRTLLWPARGGAVRASGARALALDAEGLPLRAASDGRCVYAEDGTVVVVHPMGWVTTYRGATDLAVVAGAPVRRGEWIGRATSSARVELRVDGRAVDPLAHMVGVPGRE
ncbi:MAG: M23 family metallopeptidase [Sandaracinaceae bacterium]|nr:M23 family metallopeptidase [Sandaracinaceae bacterium]